MDDIKTWTGLPVEESIRVTEDIDKWRKYVHGVANPGIEDGYKQNIKGGEHSHHRLGSSKESGGLTVIGYVKYC